MKKVGQAPLEEAAGGRSSRVVRFRADQEGEPVPNTTVRDQDGKSAICARSRVSGRRHVHVHKCPMPTFCPMMDRNFAAIQEKLKERTDAAQSPPAHRELRSADRHAARAEEARREARRRSAAVDVSSPAIATISTSSRRGFGVSVSRAHERSSATSRTTCEPRSSIAQGNLVKVYTGNEWTPEQRAGRSAPCMVGVD